LAREYQNWPKQAIGIIRSSEYDEVAERMMFGGLTEAEYMAAAQRAREKGLEIDKARMDKALALTMRYEFAVQAVLQRGLSLRQAISASIINLVAEEIAKQMEMKAKLWAAEALAAAAAGQWGSAAKFAAAAIAAGTGAAIVRTWGEEQVSGRYGQGYGSERIGEGTTTTSGGRTVISQGAMTLNYSAIMTVQGNIYDTSDLRALWNQWNLDQLRVAGVDAAKRAKG
jgi:hypothetical protein